MLSIVQTAAEEVGFVAPAFVNGNKDRTAKQLLRIANRSGWTLSRMQWPILQREHTFTTAIGVPSYVLPDGFNELISDTAWDRTNYWQLRGGLTAQEWQIRKSAITVSVSTRKRFRIKADVGTEKFFIDPTPDSAQTIVFEYLSNLWASSSTGVLKTFFEGDTDYTILPEQLMEMDCIWRFRAAKGMEYAEAKHDFDLYLETIFGAQSGAGAINMGGPRSADQAWRMNIRETGFG